MTEVSNGEIQTAAIDHYGLVAAICQELRITEKIDSRLPKDPQRKVSPGTALVTMIINGLGFTNRQLYLTHQFFESKPVVKLLAQDLEAKDITDYIPKKLFRFLGYTLGHTLDNIAEYGASQLFAEVAFEIALEHHVLGSNNHLDTTSISVQGEYEVDEEIVILRKKVELQESSETRFMKYCRFGIPLLRNLSGFYMNASIEIKQKLLGSIFPAKLHFGKIVIEPPH